MGDKLDVIPVELFRTKYEDGRPGKELYIFLCQICDCKSFFAKGMKGWNDSVAYCMWNHRCKASYVVLFDTNGKVVGVKFASAYSQIQADFFESES